jgi:hypothetical protein
MLRTLPLALALISTLCFSQRKEISLLSIMERAATQDTLLLYENITIVVDQPHSLSSFGRQRISQWLREALATKHTQIDSSNRVVIKSAIRLIDCTLKFMDDDSQLELWDLAFERELTIMNLQTEEGQAIQFRNVHFRGPLYLSGNHGLALRDCIFQNKARIELDAPSSELDIDRCRFSAVAGRRPRLSAGWIGISPSPEVPKPVVPADTLFSAVLKVYFHGERLFINDNSVTGGVGADRGISIAGDVATLEFENNHIDGYGVIEAVASTSLTVVGNDVSQGLDMTSLSFSSGRNEISWQSARSTLMKLYRVPGYEQRIRFLNQTSIETENAFSRYDGLSYDSLLEEEHYALVSTYRKLADLYRSNGRIRDANEAYIAMKNMETLRYKYEYQMAGSFSNWTHWKLNQLLRSFTVYGTDPADAMVTAVYVILVFGVFYFFFPSDWDPRSKKQLVEDFRIFIQKNEHGYWRPFWKMLGGFLVSLLNAVTLSLNAFITLGFGNIPTQGLARYVCVLQGLIGWFLLSIFTVALINQALF